MTKKAGVYTIKGSRGTRVGQSKDVPSRVAQVIRELGPRLGKVKLVEFVPVPGVKRRRQVEKKIIDKVQPSLNKIRA